VQQHRLPPALFVEGATVTIGLYDPLTGMRRLTTGGEDYIFLTWETE
jgi:hypothetical protein